MTGRPGVAFVTRGPGATNASGGIHVAYQDSTPLILFIGDVARSDRDREGFQEIDLPAFFAPVAKWAARIEDARRIPEYVARAYRVATAGRPGPVVLAVADLGATPAGERPAELRRRIVEQDATPFDLGRSPLFRAQLLHLGDEPSLLVTTFDHLICDGTAVEIFVTELVEAYRAHVARRPPALPAVDIQFADFATWQRRRLTPDVLRAQLDWWAATLDGAPFGPSVAFDRLPEVPTRRISSRPLIVSPERYRVLQHLARTTSSSLFVVCTAAVQAVLSRFGGMTDIVLSTTLSGRDRAELEGLIGMFAGVGRIRTDLTGDPPFAEVVDRARASVLGLFEHQDIPFMQVRQALWPDFPTDLIGGAAVLPIELGYFHAPARRTEPHELFFRGQLHPLSITLVDDGATIHGELSYKLDFYDEGTIDQLAVGLEAVLDAVGNSASTPLSSLPVPDRPTVP